MELVYKRKILKGDVEKSETGKGWFATDLDGGCSLYPTKKEAIQYLKNK